MFSLWLLLFPKSQRKGAHCDLSCLLWNLCVCVWETHGGGHVVALLHDSSRVFVGRHRCGGRLVQCLSWLLFKPEETKYTKIKRFASSFTAAPTTQSTSLLKVQQINLRWSLLDKRPIRTNNLSNMNMIVLLLFCRFFILLLCLFIRVWFCLWVHQSRSTEGQLSHYRLICWSFQSIRCQTCERKCESYSLDHRVTTNSPKTQTDKTERKAANRHI